MACYLPIPCPCELCPLNAICNLPEDKRTNCKIKYDEEYLNWKVTHPLFGMTTQELLRKQY